MRARRGSLNTGEEYVINKMLQETGRNDAQSGGTSPSVEVPGSKETSGGDNKNK